MPPPIDSDYEGLHDSIEKDGLLVPITIKSGWSNSRRTY
jgi:hypothetical protein